MKNLTNKQKILIVLLAVIIISGIIVTVTIGLKFDLKYEKSQKIELNLQKEFEISDIKNITDEVLEGQDVIIQKVELYEDMVSIISNQITEEQKNNIEQKVNEKYGTQIEAEDATILSIPHTRGRDIIKPYIVPFIIAIVITVIYMAIKYYKLNPTKIICETIIINIIVQLVLLSIIAIARIPIGRLTIPLVLITYILTLIGLTSQYEKKQIEIKKEENKKK